MLTLALIPLYGLADRGFGMDRPAWAEKLPVKAIILAILAGVGYLLGGFPLAGVALAWLIWRSPPWKVFGGSATPQGIGQIAGTFARHLIAAPLFAITAYWSGRSVVQDGLEGAAFALVATLLAVWLAGETAHAKAIEQPLGAQNTVLELIRGAAFGACLVGMGAT